MTNPYSLDVWQQRERDLLRAENAWLKELNPLLKVVDNPGYYMLALAIMYPVAFMLGVLIGWVL